MPVNSSSREKTVKDTFRALGNDNWTLDKTVYYANYNNTCIVPVDSILNDYNDYFSNFLEDVSVDKRFFYSPSGFSEYYYGTPDLDFIVLYFARMTSLYEFNRPVIKALPKGKLVELNKILVKYKNDIEESYKHPVEYIKQPEIEVTKKYLK